MTHRFRRGAEGDLYSAAALHCARVTGNPEVGQKRASGKCKRCADCVQAFASQNNKTKRLTVGQAEVPGPARCEVFLCAGCGPDPDLGPKIQGESAIPWGASCR
jgi:hypothetical protein